MTWFLWAYLLIGLLHLIFGWNHFSDPSRAAIRRKPVFISVFSMFAWPLIWVMVISNDK